MAAPTDIPAPLSDRTLVHGRNVMATASVILVLAWVPYIEIKKFEPLGFKITEGGELSVWGILVAVLIYYAIRFGYECWADYTGWRDTYRKVLADPPEVLRSEHEFARHAKRLRMRFWLLDVLPPALMLLAALVATYQQVDPLIWPPVVTAPPT